MKNLISKLSSQLHIIYYSKFRRAAWNGTSVGTTQNVSPLLHLKNANKNIKNSENNKKNFGICFLFCD